MAVEHIRFGPVELLMRSYRFYFWPQARGKVTDATEDLLADTTVPLDPDSFAQVNVAAQGLLALEYLLYEKLGDASAVQSSRARQCELLSAIAANMETMALEIADEWRQESGYISTALNPSADNVLYDDA